MSFGFLYGLCTLASLGGVVLLIVGLHGRRYGNTPYCRRCGYNLTALLSERCPECGTALSPDAVVIGIRRRRKVALTFGVLLLLASGGGIGVGVSDAVTRINFYPYLPFGLVLTYAEAGRPAALDEIERRYEADALRLDQVRRAADAALRIQAADPLPASAQEWINLLDRFSLAGLLTPEQQERYYGQLAEVVVTIRPKIRQGEPLSAQLQMNARAPDTRGFGPYQVRVGVKELRIEGDPLASPGLNTSGLLGGTARSMSSKRVINDFPLLPPREHRMEFDVLVEVREGGPVSSGVSAQPLSEKDFTITTMVELLPRESPDPIEALRDVELNERISGALGLREVRFVPDRYQRGPGLDLSFEIRKTLPCGLAFSIVVDSKERESLTDSGLTLTPGASIGSRYSFAIGSVGDIRPGDEVTVILRGSREQVLKTTDLYEYWDGELHFGPLTIPEDTASNLNLPARVVERAIDGEGT